jgi:hypothetical protein
LPVSAVVTPEQRRSWDDDGWCVLEGAVADDDLVAAQLAVTKLFPRIEEMAERSSAAELEQWRTWDAAWPEFPFRSRSLNGLVLSDIMLDLAQELLGTDDVRLYLAIVTAKYAGQPSEFNQLLHTDFPNHTLTVPRAEPGFQQMETFIYLNDVGLHNGATRFVSRRLTAQIPVEQHTLNFEDYGDLYESLATRRLRLGQSSSTAPMSTTGRWTSPTPPKRASCSTSRTNPRRWNGADTKRGPSRVFRWSGTTSSNKPHRGN